MTDLAALLGLDGEDLSWRDDALCAQVDTGDLFFPKKGGATKEPKGLCNGGAGREPCPVRAECLAFAMENDVRHGVWGGLSERERRRLRSQPAPVVPQRRGGWSWTDDAARTRVADLTARGWTTEDIAADLDVSARTVYRIQARQRTQRGVA